MCRLADTHLFAVARRRHRSSLLAARRTSRPAGTWSEFAEFAAGGDVGQRRAQAGDAPFGLADELVVEPAPVVELRVLGKLVEDASDLGDAEADALRDSGHADTTRRVGGESALVTRGAFGGDEAVLLVEPHRRRGDAAVPGDLAAVSSGLAMMDVVTAYPDRA